MTHTISNSNQATVHPAFELVRQQFIDALNTTVYEFRHQKTGAVHYHLASNHDENVFLVAFRTQPMDNKGIAHILEHTALCGSKKYPVRDPFFLMIRRSLNTFMNAFTAADWTCYPFATQNKKDFDNLLSVYLDAAFFANLNPLDFAQEGIRIELENNKPVFKGVVFNEMKGAMSAATDQLYHKLAFHLYPETTYHYNSGGDPKDIPDLTYEQLVEFYRSHYHPSNAILMTFGDADVYELQEKFETQALGQFEQGQTIYSVAEKRLKHPIQVQDTYAVDETDLSQKTYHVLAWLLPVMTDVKLRLGMRIVEGILMENSASPLRNYLETSKLGQSTGPLMGVDDSNYELTFYCGIQGSEADCADAFEQGVLAKLQEIAKKPIDANMVEAILHQIELHQREVGGDGTPYGLSLLLNGLSGAIHHGDPVTIWDVDTALAEIKQELEDPMWLSNLIQTHLIDNPHRVRLTLVPDNQQSKREQAAEQARLDQIEAQLDEEKHQQIIANTEALKQRQATPDNLDILPKVTLDDIPAELKRVNEIQHSIKLGQQQSSVHLYHTGTNGLFYQQVLIEVPQDIVRSPYFNLLSLLMGEVGAGDYDYLELQQQQTAISGGVGMGLSLRSQLNDKQQISAVLALTTKALHRHEDAMDLLHTAFSQIRFDEKDRIIELLQQRKARWQSRISGAAHSYAMQIASRNMSALARRDYEITGLPALRWLGQLIEDIRDNTDNYQQFIDRLKGIHQRILTAPKSFLLVCEAQYSEQHLAHLQQVWAQQQIHSTAPVILNTNYDENHDEAWLIQSNVQFCAAAYPVVDVLDADAAAFMVLGGYLRNGFLHSVIREQGGAYGGGAGYDGNACAFRFYSYRDPRLSETFADFEQSIAWLLHEQQPSHLLEEAILGLIASMDKPGSPAGEAITSCYAQLHGRDHDFRQNLRQQILAVTLDDLRRITQEYLWEKTPVRAVVAPFNRQEELSQLGFKIQRIEN
ncbi:peptidase M16 [Acinetobacter qingfengensis]|uniref:Peptidase M16 n=1 Tax=Acinetobacter qingfengensis TaxID=1262585 RepID=A0A1E7REA5_9GAMM|nr:insulinase family protein [Acinetobacter qingfengensis]KAA8734409.1 peptidase M16 [Acinetobacter qingfengensis]OEY97582.1 peptidase M16 [Acinetobacter qingfengensis]